MKKFTPFEIIAYFGFFDFFENPDLDHVQIGIKHEKIVEFPKNQKKIEKLNLDLPFAIGFIKIRQLARFLQHFEVGRFFGFST